MRRIILSLAFLLVAKAQASSQQGLPVGDLSTLGKIVGQHITVVTTIQSFGYDQPIFPRYFAVSGNNGKRVVVGVVAHDASGLRWIWWKSDLGDEFEMSEPNDFAVVRLNDGTEAVVNKGCARHLCGTNGVAGVMAFVPSANYLCTARTIHGKESFDSNCDANAEYKAYVSEALKRLE